MRIVLHAAESRPDDPHLALIHDGVEYFLVRMAGRHAPQRVRYLARAGLKPSRRGNGQERPRDACEREPIY